MDLIKKLDSMKGKTFMYNTKNYKVLQYYANNGTVVLATDKELLSIKTENAEKELKNFLEVEEEVSTAMTVIGADKAELSSLVTALKENINLVKTDAKNIPKAKAINDAVKSIIDVAKLEIDAIKLRKNL